MSWRHQPVGTLRKAGHTRGSTRHSFIGPFIGPLVHSLVRSLVHSSVHWSIGPFIGPSVHSFVYSTRSHDMNRLNSFVSSRTRRQCLTPHTRPCLYRTLSLVSKSIELNERSSEVGDPATAANTPSTYGLPFTRNKQRKNRRRLINLARRF